MLTQQQIIDRIKQLTKRQNLTWFDIRHEADRAIEKINAYLGATYPPLSEKLISPSSVYKIESDGVEYPLIEDRYIFSIVIPYIIMELLARDEEFTTVYNKYAADLEDGLFTMHQQEFNRVPLTFRQNPEHGVFFGVDSSLSGVDHNVVNAGPVYKFRVTYHLNDANIVLSTTTATEFVRDDTAYLYDEVATVLGWGTKLLSLDGLYAYTFTGWGLDPRQVTEAPIQAGAQMTMKTDLHLYAMWTKTPVLNITAMGELSIKDEFKNTLTYLQIPPTVNNIPVYSLASNFLKTNGETTAVNLQTIILPQYLQELKANALDGFLGTAVIFYEGMGVRNLTIRASAFANTPNLSSIILPVNVTAIEAGAFPVVASKSMFINARLLEANKPAAWVSGWCAESSAESNYTVSVVWGYNE